MGNFHISVLKKKILRVFLESETKNIISNGLSKNSFYIRCLPLLLNYTQVTVILLL